VANLIFWEPGSTRRSTHVRVVREINGLVKCADVRFARVDKRKNEGAAERTCVAKQTFRIELKRESSEGE